MTQQINERHPHGGDWLRDIVFGMNDGLVMSETLSTLAVALAIR